MKTKYLILLILGGVLFFYSGCNSVENLTTSSTKIILSAITGSDIDGKEGSTTVFSDVSKGGIIVNDVGSIAISAVPLNPMQEESTYYQDVIVDQVDVEYSRTEDGRNVQGVDVPFSFSQKVNLLIEVGKSEDLGFVIVQHVAKLESPLIELRTWTNQEKVLKLEAKVTVYARDVAGNRLEPVSGTISIWCSDFADSSKPTPST